MHFKHMPDTLVIFMLIVLFSQLLNEIIAPWSPLYKGGNWGSERLLESIAFYVVEQLIIQAHAFCLKVQCSFLLKPAAWKKKQASSWGDNHPATGQFQEAQRSVRHDW